MTRSVIHVFCASFGTDVEQIVHPHDDCAWRPNLPVLVCMVVLLLAESLGTIQQQGAGIADQARYAALTELFRYRDDLVSMEFLFRNRSILVSASNTTSDERWRSGLLYLNREDKALFVPKRIGFGYTLNMAKPSSWLLISFILITALMPLLLKHL